MKNYEAMVILPIALNEGECEAVMERVRGEVTRSGGTVQRVERLGRRTFARPMKKQDAGFYYTMSLSLDPATLQALRGRLRYVENLFRVQIVNETPKVPRPVRKEDSDAEPE